MTTIIGDVQGSLGQSGTSGSSSELYVVEQQNKRTWIPLSVLLLEGRWPCMDFEDYRIY